jgi:hypothetical protein
MHLEEINNCIAEYEQYNFKFSDDFLTKIRKECNSWKNDWIVSFRKQLRRIKKDEGTDAYDEMNGKRVTTPIVKDRYMAIYFLAQDDGSYFIYDYLINLKDKI